MQESEVDGDSITSRFRILVPIMLGTCHILACLWWYVGSSQLPNIWIVQYDYATNGSLINITMPGRGSTPATLFNHTLYEETLAKHWIGAYSGERSALPSTPILFSNLYQCAVQGNHKLGTLGKRKCDVLIL